MGEALLAVLPGAGWIGSLATPSSGSRFFFGCLWKYGQRLSRSRATGISGRNRGHSVLGI